MLIDDNQADRILAIRHLKQVFPDVQIQEIFEPQQLAQVLDFGQFDLVITDYQLRWSDGLKVLNAVKSRYPDCPVIMFTSSGSEEVAVEGMKFGLSDYVLKGKRVNRLSIAVQESLKKAQLHRQYEAATQQLQISETRYRMVSELTSDFAYAYRITTDQKWIREWITEAFSRITGYTLEEIDAQGGYATLVHPDDQARFQQHRLNLLAGQPDISEFRIITKQGIIRWLRNSDRPEWNDAEQRVTVVYGAAQDITEPKAAAAAIQRQATELAEANRLKDEFLTTLSHELRTPLSAILGWTQVLQSRLQQKDEMIARALDIIERNARAQTQLVEDILDVSRIIQGKLKLNRSPTSLIPVIQAAIESMRPAIEAKSIYLITELDQSIGSLLIDPNRFQQVVWNLLSNAIKFTPTQGEVKIVLKQVKGFAQLRVSDTGIGIAPDFLPFVFDRFRQADSSTTRTHQGMGLGLAIVRHLTEMHGGTVQVQSLGLGQGATFTVELPLQLLQVKETVPQLQSFHEKTQPLEKTLAGIAILVVDDDSDTREITAIILKQQGATITTAKSAAAALAILAQQPLDLLISDIAMPDEDGYSLIRRIRQQSPPQSKIPAIALSAYARIEDRSQAIAAGYQLHLAKPVEPNELTDAVLNLTKRSIS